MSATEVPDIVQRVLNMESIAISSMSEEGSELSSYMFWGFLKTYNGFLSSKKLT